MCEPVESPVMVWLPLAAVLLRPGPLTDTAVAFAHDHVIVEVPGAAHVPGLALMDALTDAAA